MPLPVSSSVISLVTTAELDFLRKLVREKSGIVLGEDKNYLLDSRLLPVARAAGLAGLSALVAQMRAQPHGALTRLVLEAMTTNETFFFRDVYPFEALEKTVMPDLLIKRQATRTLNIWCGAASSGQEPYSIALVLRDRFPQLMNWKITFIATDLASEVLAKARAGRYSQMEVARGMPPALLAKYFSNVDGAWQVREDLRKLIDFRELNLLDNYTGIPHCDLVFMRNVLIYFDVDTKRAILGKIRKLLAPDGYLFLGGAETTLNIDDHYERLQLDRAGCYRQRVAVAAAV